MERERVPDLSWASRFGSKPSKAPPDSNRCSARTLTPTDKAANGSLERGFELNPHLARVLERVKQNERERAQ
jgi:hypothetical protein